MFASTVADNHLHFTWLQLKGAASATMYWKSSSRTRSQPLTVAGTTAGYTYLHNYTYTCTCLHNYTYT